MQQTMAEGKEDEGDNSPRFAVQFTGTVRRRVDLMA